MSKRKSSWLIDMLQLARRASGLAVSARAEGKSGLKAALPELLDELPLVQRDEFEIVRELAQKASDRQDQLDKRIAALENAAKRQP